MPHIFGINHHNGDNVQVKKNWDLKKKMFNAIFGV